MDTFTMVQECAGAQPKAAGLGAMWETQTHAGTQSQADPGLHFTGHVRLVEMVCKRSAHQVCVCGGEGRDVVSELVFSVRKFFRNRPI